MTDAARKDQKPRILVVEDEPGIAGFVRRGLLFEGYAVQTAADGRAALAALRDDPPDLLILDVMVPGVDGLEIARRLRDAEQADHRPPMPVIMLTARDTVPDRIAGLDAGADDYLVKPFSFEELLARVRAQLRRVAASAPPPGETLSCADLSVDLGGRIVRRGERDVSLTTREYDLLLLLLRNQGQVLTRQTIRDRVWGPDFYGDDNVLEVFISTLRRALETGGEPRLIQTVRGVGYVLRETA